MKSKYEEIDIETVLEQSFAAGQGVVALSASMSDEQILTLIKGACTWSKGKAFQVIPAQATSAFTSSADSQQFKLDGESHIVTFDTPPASGTIPRLS